MGKCENSIQLQAALQLDHSHTLLVTALQITSTIFILSNHILVGYHDYDLAHASFYDEWVHNSIEKCPYYHCNCNWTEIQYTINIYDKGKHFKCK